MIGSINPWKRKWWWYECTFLFQRQIGHPGFYQYPTFTITRKLGPISYHLIKLKHGEEKLIEMANESPVLVASL